MRRKLHSDTLIGLSAQDALRRKAELDGTPAPRSSVPTLIGEANWPPRWESSDDDLQTEETPDEWCAALRSNPTPSSPAPQHEPPASVSGSIHPSTDAVFVATLPPPNTPTSRLPMIAVLCIAFASVAAMAVVAAIQSSEEGPVWRLAQGLPNASPTVVVSETSAAPAAPAETPKPAAAPPSPSTATLVIDAGPRGCDLWIDGSGRRVRGRAALRVPPGPHSIACRRAGKVEGRRVVVAENKTAHVRFSR